MQDEREMQQEKQRASALRQARMQVMLLAWLRNKNFFFCS